MKKLFVMAATAVIVVAMAGWGFAAGTTATANLTATGTVVAKCGLITPGNFTFDIDPSSGAANMAGSNTTIRCTKNDPIAVDACGVGQASGTPLGSCTPVAVAGGKLTGFLNGGGSAIGYSLNIFSGFLASGFSTDDILINPTGASNFTLTSGYADAVLGTPYTETITLQVNY